MPKNEPKKLADKELEAQREETARQVLTYEDGTQIKVGDTVRFRRIEVRTGGRFAADAAVETRSESPLADPDETFDVAIVNDPLEHPGYAIGLLASKAFEGGHDLEGAVSENQAKLEVIDERRFGRGWWAVGWQLESAE